MYDSVHRSIGSRARRLGVGLILMGCILGSWASQLAAAQSGSRQSAELRFDEQLRATPTAVTLNIDYVNPDDPNAKPPAVRQVVAEFAEGTQIDTSVPEKCTASDAELMLTGPTACPDGSRVGEGFVRIDTGLPEPNRFLEEDLTLLNNTDQLIFLFRDRASGLRLASRAPIEGRRITTTVPPLPGTPPDGAATDVVQERFYRVSRQVGAELRGYITTPPDCPQGGAWLNSVSFTYADAASQTVTTSSPCIALTPATCDGKAVTILGTNGADVLTGTPGNDVIYAGAGNDLLNGAGGADRICAGPGHDKVYGYPGNDLLFGGDGNDFLSGGAGADFLRGGNGNDTCSGGAGPDQFSSC